jgi:hypothetical protein
MTTVMTVGERGFFQCDQVRLEVNYTQILPDLGREVRDDRDGRHLANGAFFEHDRVCREHEYFTGSRTRST